MRVGVKVGAGVTWPAYVACYPHVQSRLLKDLVITERRVGEGAGMSERVAREKEVCGNVL